jgi:hypothetical protein
VSKEQEVQIFARAFTEDGVEFEVTWWTGSRPVDIRRSRDEVIAAVKRALDEAGLKVAVPRALFADILRRIDRLRGPPVLAA